jgi:hypothetical protein
MTQKIVFATLAVLVLVGTMWSFGRGGHDFAVFYEAWNLVAHGHGTEIYTNSPDRFLYAPGFAWILAPLGFFPEPLALAIWNFAKIAVIFLLVRAVGNKIVEESSSSSSLPMERRTGFAIAAAGFILLARPLLIDFQYGQVNTFILGGSLWALLEYF